MKLKIVLNILLIILVFIFQYSFIAHFKILRPIDFSLVLLVYMLLIFDRKIAIYWTFSLGLLMELYSEFPFGTILISLATTFCLVELLFYKLFTNNSLTTMLSLGFITTFVYEIVKIIILFIAKYLGSSYQIQNINLPNLLIKSFYQIIILSILFVITAHTSQRLKSSLLKK